VQDKCAIVKATLEAGLLPKPEVFGASPLSGGYVPGSYVSVGKIIGECEALIEAGAWKLMIEEAGLFDGNDPEKWRRDMAWSIATRIPPALPVLGGQFAHFGGLAPGPIRARHKRIHRSGVARIRRPGPSRSLWHRRAHRALLRRFSRLMSARPFLRSRTAQDTMAAVAYSWGFPDQANFTRAFRRVYGTSPREYRRTQ